MLPLTRDDGHSLHVNCYYCADAVETIISPTAVLASSTVFCQWTQIGYKDPTLPGSLKFSNATNNVSMTISLTCRNGLYYCQTDTYAQDITPVRTKTYKLYTGERPKPTTKARQIESELWLLRFGSPCESQLNTLPLRVTGLPSKFEWHPFRYIDFKEQAYARKQPVNKFAKRLPQCGSEFYMDFGFMRSSTSDYKKPNKQTDRVVLSYDGYSAYLIIVDGTS